jgi:predicted RNA-binding protein with TRAM domain
MHRALLELVIDGVETSRDFHLRLMEDGEFRRGEIEIQWLERRLDSLTNMPPPPSTARIAAVAAALLAEKDRGRGAAGPQAAAARPATANATGALLYNECPSDGSAAGRTPRASNHSGERALMPEMVSLEIESIAAGGDGVGRSNGLVVFVPRTAPGDLVTARIAAKASFARGTLRTVTRPSPVRVDPPCPHYTRDRCGGCQIQHMSYDSQLRAKRRIIRDSLERIGKRKVGEPEIRASRNEWRYRAKLTLAMRQVRSRKMDCGIASLRRSVADLRARGLSDNR